MKTQILSLLLVCIFGIGTAQTDTLFTKKQQKIPCKITEINEYEIKYSQANLPDGPVYVINKTLVLKYTLSNGFSEQLVPDEMLIENEHSTILKNRSAIKISPFSLMNNHIALGYEKVIKVGMNLDVEVGYINNAMNSRPLFGTNMTSGQNGQPAFYTGGYLKPGIKFFLGQDYSVRGLKYAHPLKGHYVRLELAMSFLNFRDVERYNYIYGAPAQSVKSNISTLAYGGFVNYGRQFILGNILTMEYYVGVGFTGQSDSYSNPMYLANNTNYGYYGYNEVKNVGNYHGFLRIPGPGLSFTGGFRIGYILPDKWCAPKKQNKAIKS